MVGPARLPAQEDTRALRGARLVTKRTGPDTRVTARSSPLPGTAVAAGGDRYAPRRGLVDPSGIGTDAWVCCRQAGGLCAPGCGEGHVRRGADVSLDDPVTERPQPVVGVQDDALLGLGVDHGVEAVDLPLSLTLIDLCRPSASMPRT